MKNTPKKTCVVVGPKSRWFCSVLLLVGVVLLLATTARNLAANASDISIWPFLPNELGSSITLNSLNKHKRFGFVGNPASFHHRRFSIGASHVFTDPIKTYSDKLNGSETQDSLVFETPLPWGAFWGTAVRFSSFSDLSRNEFGQKGIAFTFVNAIADNAMAVPYEAFGMPGTIGLGVAYWNSHLQMRGRANNFLNHNVLFHVGLLQHLKNDWTAQVVAKNVGVFHIDDSRAAEPTKHYHVSLRKQLNTFFQAAFDYALFHERGNTSSPLTNTISASLMLDVPLVEPPGSRYSQKRSPVPQIGASVMYNFDIAPYPPPQIGASLYIDLALGKKQAFMRISYGALYNDFIGYRQAMGASYHF